MTDYLFCNNENFDLNSYIGTTRPYEALKFISNLKNCKSFVEMVIQN